MNTIYDTISQSYQEKVNAYVPGNETMNNIIVDLVENIHLSGYPIVSIGPGPGLIEKEIRKNTEVPIIMIEQSSKMSEVAQFNNPESTIIHDNIETYLTTNDQEIGGTIIGMSLHEQTLDEKKSILNKISQCTVDGGFLIWKDFIKIEDDKEHISEINKRFDAGQQIMSVLSSYDEDEESEFAKNMRNKELNNDNPITVHQMKDILSESGYHNIIIHHHQSTFAIISATK